MTFHRCAALLAGLALGLPLAAPSSDAAESSVRLRYTSYGIPHVESADFLGAGYGLGYAFARDNLCIGVELALTLAGERSAAFGEDGTYVDPHLGTTPVRNLDSDVYAKFIYTDSAAASMRAQMSSDAQALVTGYVRGFNRRLAETPIPARPLACREAPWLRPLTEDDIYRRVNHISVLQSTHVFLSSIAAAQPPDARTLSAPPATARLVDGAGSNMAAFGREATANGRGLSFANPHFPWSGPQRFYVAQLTVRGKYDVFGGLLYGAPFILLGFNRDLGWSITYSTNHRLSLYRLDLVPGSPTRYLVDGQPRDIERVSITVPAKTAAGKAVTRSRTLYRSADGPVIDSSVFPWTQAHAFVLKDANRNLGRWPDQFLALGRSLRVQEVKAASERIRGLMFSNVTAADRHGNAYYGNFSPAINMPDADLSRCLVADGEQIIRDRYLVVLDGARSQCAWRRNGDPIEPEILPASRSPWAMRRDYVLHANDSHWTVNAEPRSVLEGFDRVIGVERVALGDRTRTGLRLVERRLAGADGLPGNKMTPETLRRLMYRAETVIGEAIRDDAARDCRDNPRVDRDGVTFDLTAACRVLTEWDGTARAESRGGVLARELIMKLPREVRSAGLTFTPPTFRVPFDRSRPIETPAGLVASAQTRQALLDAVFSLDAAGIAPNAPLSDSQFLVLSGRRVPVSGFPYTFLRYVPTFVPEKSITEPVFTYGDSYIHAVTFDDDGPLADIALTYSQSTDPRSVHSNDLTLAYLQEQWIRVPFLDRDIEHDPGYRLIELDPRQ